MCAGRGLSLSVLGDISTAIWIGRELGAQAVIIGRLTNHADALDMTLTCYRTRDLKPLAGLRVTLPTSVEMKSLLNKKIEYLAVATGVKPAAGTNGYTFPKCLHCPPAAYSQQAADEKISGIVVLDAIVGKDGKAHEISVAKGLPYGLTKQALGGGEWVDFQACV
jgi:Gram-negative bacterial TonB protein C-terminal